MQVTPSRVRVILSGLILACFFFSALVLIWRGWCDSLVAAAMADAFQQLLQFYLPMLSVLTAFYFSAKKGEVTQDLKPFEIETVVIATLLAGVWAALPIVTLSSQADYQSAFSFIAAFKGYGDSVANVVLVYCFVRST